MSYRIRVARRAQAQIRKAADWWVDNRPKAPTAFSEEIARGFELIRAMPGIGEPVAHPNLPDIRRLLLGRVQYHLYYAVSHEEEAVEVLALWHTSRRQPKL